MNKHIVEESAWDLEIKPHSSLFNLNLKDIWNYRDLMLLLVRRDFVAQYKQTILGPIWHFIQPILTTVMFILIFSKIAQIPTDGVQPVLFYLSGITIWNYFSICLTNTSNTFLANASIFGKVYFPRLIMPISIVISNMVRFVIQFVLLIVAMIYYQQQGEQFHINFWNWLLIPPLLILMAGIGLGLGIIISSFTTKYRDFTVLLGFAVQLGMYITPIVYPLSYIQNSPYRKIIALNPLTPIVETFRYALFGTNSLNYSSLAYSVAFMAVALVLGMLMFNKVEKSFMDTV